MTQLTVAAALALIFLIQSPAAALAAALGGGSMALGTALTAWRGFPEGAPAADSALWRLVSGVLLKFLLVGLALVLGLGVWQLPPLPLLLGLIAGMLAFAIAAARRT